jgi:hypothetical protein
MNGQHGDWCERLAGAIADGRYLEDPVIWRDHVESCAPCAELVQGLVVLRERIDRVASRVRAESLPTAGSEVLIAEAFRRYRRARRVKGLSLGLVLLVGAALGLAFAWRGAPSPERTAPDRTDAVAYANHLEERVFRGSNPDYDLLKRDERLREEYLAALDHESSLVRRTALHALTFSGVEMDAARLTDVLTSWNENLEAPVQVAALAEGRRHLEDALARRRDDTLTRVLGGAYVQAAQGGARLDAALVESFVDYPAATVRSYALRALGQDPTYRPGERIVRRWREDEDAEVRKAAAALLVDRLGDDGVDLVVDRLRAVSDWQVEGHVLVTLGERPSVLALARERIRDPQVPPQLALHHLRHLARASEVVEPPAGLLERALADEDPWTWSVLARVAAERDLRALRSDLQERWTISPPGAARTSLAHYLVSWDCTCPSEARQLLALDILEAERDGGLHDEALRGHVETLSGSALLSVRARAQNLLSNW